MSQLVIPTDAITSSLNTNLSAVATSIQVASTSGFDATGILSLGEKEIVTYSGISGAYFTGVTRGTNGTTARSFLLGTNVYQVDAMATEAEVAGRNLTIQYQDEGIDVSTKGGIDYVNFTGNAVTAEQLVAGTLIVTVDAPSNADAIAYAIALG